MGPPYQKYATGSGRRVDAHAVSGDRIVGEPQRADEGRIRQVGTAFLLIYVAAAGARSYYRVRDRVLSTARAVLSEPVIFDSPTRVR